MSAPTLTRDNIHATWRENALVITGVHAEDFTQAQLADAARDILAALQRDLPGLIVGVTVESFVTTRVAHTHTSAPESRDVGSGAGAATTSPSRPTFPGAGREANLPAAGATGKRPAAGSYKPAAETETGEWVLRA